MKDWFYDFKLKCRRKLYMFEVCPSTVGFDLESKYSEKPVGLDPGWFYNFKLKIKDVESWPRHWIDFMISSWNVEENKLTPTRVDFMISNWNVEKN